ncbi:amidohydrolase [Mesorhizobium sp. SB112]|uniref:amidohydrolase family protein n=1 Tax=Mesorhizobium sp. SB112 TaxID=3151853 RepID=UPI003262E729
MLIDTHLHLIDLSMLRYPWLVGAPSLNRDFLYAEYEVEAKRAGIEATLHMEVDVDPQDIDAETSYVRAVSSRPGNLISGAIVACRPEERGFAEYLEKQKSDRLVKGFRRVLHVMPDDLSEGALFRENIKRIGSSGLTFDLCVLPHQIPKAIALADLAPDVQFILDHCGVPDIKGSHHHPWREQITEIAKRPNVTAKISGVVAYADPSSWTVETLRPFVQHTIGEFGWDRVVWGSDWPVCTLGGGLATWVAATHALLDGTSENERGKLYSGNAKRIWKLDA